jgi:hypothetical protein
MSLRALKGIGAALLLVVLPSVGRAGLEWEAQLIQITAGPADREAIARFHFKNAGAEPVTIRELRPSCSCTRAETAKSVYAPGDSGEVKALFTFGGQTGLREKRIQVITDEPATQADVLTLRVEIPEVLTYAPHRLLWHTGEAPTEKSIVVEPGAAHAIVSLQIQSVRPKEMTARIEAIDGGKRYRLMLRPLSTARTATVAVALSAKADQETVHPFTVFALVR